MGADLDCWNIADLRERARRRLPLGVWEYLERGVEDETGMSRNRADIDAVRFVPRVARSVETIDTACEILGKPAAFPLAIGPTGAAGIVWHKGDIHLARAAAKAGIPFTISSASTMDIEHIAEAGGRLWFQLYMWERRELSYAVVDRARDAGCDTLFVTMDLPVPPNREYLMRNGYGMPFGFNRRNLTDMLRHPRWLAGTMGRYMLDGGMPGQANLPEELRSSIARGSKPGTYFKQDNLDWDEIAALRDRWPGNFVLKGVLHPQDAERALALGADAVVVSNHGGRSLDHSVSSMEALPDVVAAVDGKMAVLFDSGVRRGSDIVKARALGAQAALVGRAALYGLGAAGEAGVTRAIALLQEEFRRTMGMLGLCETSQITREVVRP